ncbi:DUF6382 domain-containing protein [Butyrivibrio sp. MC2021]|uniref:DUF6382 domain-containing protein n=1 Tax=Butyrivibrio sp. MC2021 TaxID=1408306 RepID=UPI000478D61D|nr:DUF6382 domain-containing protein [Butyrivibrio sp. MC2021]
MNYKYYRDLKHNYLVVKLEKQSEGEAYQLKILSGGRLAGLLPCDVRNVNGEQFLYYEIGSMQSLRDRYTSRGMNRAQQLQLFSDMKDMLEGLSEYLLGEDGVVFDADSIFVDLTTGRYSFMFCPFAAAEGGFEKLTEQLLDMTNSEDEEAATAIYELCEYATGKGAMTIEGIEKLLKAAPACEKETPLPAVIPPGESISFEPEDSDDEDEDEEDDEEAAVFAGIRSHKSFGLKRAEQKLGARAQLLLAGLFALLVAGMVYVRKAYILTSQENYMSMAVMAVSLVCGALCFVSGFKGYRGKNMPDEEKVISHEDISESEEEEEEEPGFSYNYDYEEPVNESFYKTPLKITAGSSGDGCVNNATMVLNMDEEISGPLNLYSRNLDKTVRICLDKLPLTIGKMEGCVDKVLKDMSVSRIHCRIFRDEDSGRLALVDLNSTNGTFKNGLKLTPQEKNYIDEGDEVRIGRICFDCR